MTESKRKSHKDQKPVKTRYFQGKLGCQRCGNTFIVSEFNEHRKVVNCPVCGEQNDLNEAKKRAA